MFQLCLKSLERDASPREEKQNKIFRFIDEAFYRANF